MAYLKTRLILGVLVVLAFLGPFLAVVSIENAKRAEQEIRRHESATAMKKAADDARYQYYLQVEANRQNLKQAMEEAKTQYETLLKNQDAMIQENQKTVTQTVIEPVVVQKKIEQSTASAPKSSSTTKTS